VVLTHFHADHIDGLPGVLHDRRVAEVAVSGLREPMSGARQVDAWTAAAGVPVRSPAYGEVVSVGELSWRVLAPRRVVSDNPNDASVVLLVETRGIRLLLAGDVEPPSQALLASEAIGQVDVLKVPHHGSAHQDQGFLLDLGARVGLVSVGEDNGYGHPDPDVLDLLADNGTLLRRTDQDGDLAVVARDGELRVVSSR
jgi:competence protein ComEC